MNVVAKAALEKSIAHWERMANGTRNEGEIPGTLDCALCRLYYDSLCHGCPVMSLREEQP